MSSPLTHDLSAALRRLDACRISNAIETFDCRLRNEGFASGQIRANAPDLPPVVGHAVTATIRCSAPPAVGQRYHDRTDWWSFILTVPPPRIVVVEDVDEHPGTGAFVGHVHAQILEALGCVAYITNGSVRDVPAVRAMRFQTFSTSVAVSHAFVHIVDVGSPVTIGGLAIASGEIVYGDVHGVLTIPADVVADIPAVAVRMSAQEEQVVALCQSADFSLDKLRAVVGQLA